MIKNICTLLFVATISAVISGYYFFLFGRSFTNHWLAVSIWNDAYAQGHLRGGTEAIYLIFEDYIKSHPYKRPITDIKENEDGTGNE